MDGYVQENGKSSEDSLNNPEKKCTSWNDKIPARYVLALISFFGMAIIILLRVNLSVAIITMTNTITDVDSDINISCPISNSTTQRLKRQQGEFDWDSKEQGLILASFYYGYICTQLIGGWLTKFKGGKLLFGGSVLWCAVLTLLTPIAARFSLTALVSVRILQGLGQGATFPALHAIWGKWAPVSERSTLAAFSYSGTAIGCVLGLSMSGVLAESNIFGGWPSVFYVFGIIGVIWFIPWMLLTSSTPAEHPRISREERSYIETSIGPPNKRLPIPWLSIITSSRVWAINVGHFCFTWNVYLMLSCLPLYMKYVLGFDISENGLLSAIPYLLMWLLSIVSGILADFLRKEYLSTTTTRKVMNSLGLLIPAVVYITIKYVGCDRNGALAMVIISVASVAFINAGCFVNHLDIAPDFAGTLMGISNTLATIPGFVAPTVVGYMTAIPDVREGWMRVFHISAGINVFGAIFYIIFVSGKSSEDSLKNPEKKCTSWNDKIPARYVLALISFFGMAIIILLRVNLSVAIITMTNTITDVDSDINISCPISNSTTQRLKRQQGEFDWDSKEQGLILASFYYGCICTQLIGGWLTKFKGGKLLFGGSVLWCAVLTLLTPIAARFSLTALVSVRILQGLGQGATLPALHALWGKWAPVSERSTLAVFSYSGTAIGCVLGLSMSGVLAESNIFGGWPSVFYVFGIIGVIWFIPWMLLTSSTPAEHPRISREERGYIETSLGPPNKRLPIPWLSIITSSRVWAINVGQFCYTWNIFLMLSCLPLYMKYVLGFDISENGLLSAIPYLLMWLLSIVSGILADFLRKEYLSTTTTRKVMNSLGLLIPAVVYITIEYVGCDRNGALAMVIISVASVAFINAGCFVNHLDIAPDFAGTLMGMSNTLATIPGFVAPTVVGYMTAIPDVREGWIRVFHISAGINVFGAIFYIIFVSGEIQKWAVVHDTETESIVKSH